MKSMTATEAGRNFSSALKQTDQDGLLMIKKGKNKEYILLTSEIYDSLSREHLYGRRGDELFKVEFKGGRASVCQILIGEDDLIIYRLCNMPAEALTVTRAAGRMLIRADLTGEDKKTRFPYSTMVGEDYLFELSEETFDLTDPAEKETYSEMLTAKNVAEELQMLDKTRIADAEVEILVKGHRKAFNMMSSITD